MKVLDEAYVSEDISKESFENVVGNITAHNCLSFADDEFLPEGRGHNKALHISVRCRGHNLANVLIDNGSSLNVLPRSTLDQLGIDRANLSPSSIIVRAFDGTQSGVLGEIELPVEIGPCTFYITFQVMNVSAAYSCLLGRPWIHSAGAIPSSLHQKVKFVHDGRLIEVTGEEDLLISALSSTPYIAAEDEVGSTFQTFEVVNATYAKDGIPPPSPRHSSAALMLARVLKRGGFQPGKGLGDKGQGIREPVHPLKNDDTYGLGFKPTRADRAEMARAKKERRLARLEGRVHETAPLVMKGLYQTFVSAGLRNPNVVAVIEDGPPGRIPWVQPSTAENELKNWTARLIPSVFSLETM